MSDDKYIEESGWRRVKSQLWNLADLGSNS